MEESRKNIRVLFCVFNDVLRRYCRLDICVRCPKKLTDFRTLNLPRPTEPFVRHSLEGYSGSSTTPERINSSWTTDCLLLHPLQCSTFSLSRSILFHKHINPHSYLRYLIFFTLLFRATLFPFICFSSFLTSFSFQFLPCSQHLLILVFLPMRCPSTN